MQKKLLVILFLFTGFIALHAQVRDGRTTIDTTVRSAVIIESDLSQSEVENAIESYFDSMHIEKEKGKGFIIKKSMGYMLFRRAKVENVSDALDVYFVTENKKQKGKDASTVYITASRGLTNFLTPDNDQKVWSQLRDYASYMQSNYFEQYKLYVQLADVSKDMDKKKKKLDDVLKEKADLESNISNDSLQIVNFNEALLKLKIKKQ
ncbi:hypothetical protein FRZ67_19550 [Panacibacter ginsenosidivorans]|uniref:DUF4468 domain-containing protein n=1 Tax=Panacibacter ginsenosidivorans TaxID=1813871 RepID=A0A5B8VDN8_9BACT|nr:hypothetical protein [Panacibacter ginsenosidivorans]QEC69389.1 hypothetical protein FRZ67_19550 [Panacibacter ginsenosidivorans]